MLIRNRLVIGIGGGTLRWSYRVPVSLASYQYYVVGRH